jgi:hypothetical protein
MTDLQKPVTRRCTVTLDGGKRIVIALLPGDLLALRRERERKTYFYPIGAVYSSAVKAHVLASKKEKGRAR